MPADTILVPEAKYAGDVIVPSPGNEVRSGGVVGFLDGSVRRGFQGLLNKIFAFIKGKVTVHSLDADGTGEAEVLLPIAGRVRAKRLVITTDGADIDGGNLKVAAGYVQASEEIVGKWLDLGEFIADSVLPSARAPIEGQLHAEGITFARAKVIAAGTYKRGWGIKTVEKLAGNGNYRITTLYCPTSCAALPDGTDLDHGTNAGPSLGVRLIGSVAGQITCSQQVITVDAIKRVEITVKTFDGAGNASDRGFDLYVYP